MENRKSFRNSAKSSSSSDFTLTDQLPVALQGWLFKQGGDGLMLWKKRWFVLSEFCLFYYKSPDETKASGSILLPSYKISPVSKDDNVSRKYSFKAQHQNMRTYFFAAESREDMLEWMNALSLASILQLDINLSSKYHSYYNHHINSSSPTQNHSPNRSQFNSSRQSTQHHIEDPSSLIIDYRRSNSRELTPSSYDGHNPAPMRYQKFNAIPPSQKQIYPAENVQLRHHKQAVGTNYQNNLYLQQRTAGVRSYPQINLDPRTYQNQHIREAASSSLSPDRQYPHPFVPNILPHHQQEPKFPPHQQIRGHSANLHSALVDANRFYYEQYRRQMLPTQPLKQLSQQPYPPAVRQQQKPQRPQSPGIFYPLPQGATPSSSFASSTSNQERQLQVQRPKSSIDNHRPQKESYSANRSHNEYLMPKQENGQHISRIPTQLHQENYYQKSAAVVQPLPRKTLDTSRLHHYDHSSASSQTGYNDEVSSYFQSPSHEKTHFPTSSTQTHYLAPKILVDNHAARPVFGNDNSAFKGPANAALNKDKKNQNASFNRGSRAHEYSTNEENKRKEQYDESMRRLHEWKQRMLQSPLTRKSSRTQTPIESCSPVIHRSRIRQQVMKELELQEQHQQGRAAVSSVQPRSKSLPRSPKSMSTSSDEDDAGDTARTQHSKRRTLSAERKQLPLLQSNAQPLELNYEDLLDKSHDQLVLMLVRLRRQSDSLRETIDRSKAELSSVAQRVNPVVDESPRMLRELQAHIRELEGQRARGQPVINLVDNMVKIGSVQKNSFNDDVQQLLLELHHIEVELRLERLNVNYLLVEKDLVEGFLDQINHNVQTTSINDSAHYAKQQEMLKNELHVIKKKLGKTRKRLEHNSEEHVSWEQRMLDLRKDLNTSVSGHVVRDSDGNLDETLTDIQSCAAEMHKDRQEAYNRSKQKTASSKKSGSHSSEIKKPKRMKNSTKVTNDDLQATHSQNNQPRDPDLEEAPISRLKRGSKERSTLRPPSQDWSMPPPSMLSPHYNHESSQALPPSLSQDQTMPQGQINKKEPQYLSPTYNHVPSSNGSQRQSFAFGSNYLKKGKELDRPASSLSAHERLFGSSSRGSSQSPLGTKNSSPMSLSPAFKSTSAKEIAGEVGQGGGREVVKSQEKNSSKPRSHTISSGSGATAAQALKEYQTKMGTQDDINLSRPRANAPDVVKSTLDKKKKDTKISTATIDNLFGAPEKINIPERYIPEMDTVIETPFERHERLRKANSIKKMLVNSSATPSAYIEGSDEVNNVQVRSQEKKEIEHLLSLKQLIAHQVMEKSRLVASKNAE